MAKRDLFSESDPYIVVNCGRVEFNDRQNYCLNTTNPEIYKCFEFMETFPGAHDIKIDVYDYNEFFGDEIIGKTSIDLDDRYFSNSWQSIDNKPIEYRDLYHQSCNRSQGTLKLWLEIDEKNT